MVDEVAGTTIPKSRKITITRSCQKKLLGDMLKEKIPQISFSLRLDKTISEVKTWTVLDYLALGSIEISTDCLNLV